MMISMKNALRKRDLKKSEITDIGREKVAQKQIPTAICPPPILTQMNVSNFYVSTLFRSLI